MQKMMVRRIPGDSVPFISERSTIYEQLVSRTDHGLTAVRVTVVVVTAGTRNVDA